MLNANVTLGGKGDELYRVTERDLFRGSVEKGWSGASVGQPISWHVVELTRQNDTGRKLKFAIHQTWRQVKGEWRIAEAGYKYLD